MRIVSQLVIFMIIFTSNATAQTRGAANSPRTRGEKAVRAGKHYLKSTVRAFNRSKVATVSLLVSRTARLLSSKGPRYLGEKRDPVEVLPAGQPGRLVISVVGGAGSKTSQMLQKSMRDIGEAIATSGHVTLTGASKGLPDIAVQAAKQKGGLTIGISPWSSESAHKKAGSPTNFDVIQLTKVPDALRQKLTRQGLDWRAAPNLMASEITNIHHSDAVIVAGGRFGTLGEIAVALQDGRPLGVLTNSGGMADEVRSLVKASRLAGKRESAPVLFDSNPRRLVTRLLKATKRYNQALRELPAVSQ